MMASTNDDIPQHQHSNIVSGGPTNNDIEAARQPVGSLRRAKRFNHCLPMMIKYKLLIIGFFVILSMFCVGVMLGMAWAMPSPSSPKKKQYRPKATSLIRTINLDNNGSSGGEKQKTPPTTNTTIILQLFSDRIFLSITQLSGIVGSLLVCNVEESIIDNSTTYHVGTMLGTGAGGDHDSSFREVFVRRIAERIVVHARTMAGVGPSTILGGSENGVGPIPPLVVGLGLKPNNRGGKNKRMSVESFNTLVDATVSLYEEGWRIFHAGGMVGFDAGRAALFDDTDVVGLVLADNDDDQW